MMNKIRKLFLPLSLILVPSALVICLIFKLQQTALIAFITVIISILSFFLQYESLKPKVRDIMPIIVMSSIAAVSRIIFAPFPNFKPITAIIIVSGACFGSTGGFMTGAISALASNLYFGQGEWTPWQMYAWGLIGFMAGILKKHGVFEKSFAIYIFGFLSAIVYGFILDCFYVIGFVSPLNVKTALAAYLAGLPLSVIHAVSTVIFLIPIYKPWSKKILRIKTKFGIMNN